MDTCLTCNAEIVQTAGKRKKLYCSALCRQKAWNKRQTIPDPVYIEGGLYEFKNGAFSQRFGYAVVDIPFQITIEGERKINDVVHTPDGKYVVTTINNISGIQKNECRIWNPLRPYKIITMDDALALKGITCDYHVFPLNKTTSIADIPSTKVDVDKLANAVKNKNVRIPPLNKEDEKQINLDSIDNIEGIPDERNADLKIKYKTPDALDYDTKKVNKAVIDEIGQWKEPAPPPIPVREKGEDKFDFAARKNDWKRKYGNH